LQNIGNLHRRPRSLPNLLNFPVEGQEEVVNEDYGSRGYERIVSESVQIVDIY
jgi:hypothetical protein